MKIPIGPSGFPTVSPSQLRVYGAGGFRLDEQEGERGCPRLYKAKYVDRRVEESRGDALAYGSFFHDVMYRLEQGETPEEALEHAFPVDMDPAFYAEARRDLDEYLQRGASPSDRFATIAVEEELAAELYVDEDFGPIWLRGILDWIGIDPDLPQIVHGVDYKTNRTPPSEDDVRGDVQLKAYDWLLRQVMAKWGGRRVVMHLDAVKWREVEVAFNDRQIEDWHSWVVAVVRKILRDEEAKPKINPGCPFCPVRGDCPAYEALPVAAKGLADAKPDADGTPEQRLAWAVQANAVRLLLEKGVADVMDGFKRQALREQGLVVGDTQWAVSTDWKDVWDLRSLHVAMGPSFYDVITTSKAAVNRVTGDWDTHAIAEVMACVKSTPVGSKVTMKKAKG